MADFSSPNSYEEIKKTPITTQPSLKSNASENIYLEIEPEPDYLDMNSGKQNRKSESDGYLKPVDM